MRARDIGLFCCVCLGATLGVFGLLFQRAALSPEAAAQARTPQPMTAFEPIDLGSPYGEVSMIDLVGEYLEHPPRVAESGAPAEKKLDLKC